MEFLPRGRQQRTLSRTHGKTLHRDDARTHQLHSNTTTMAAIMAENGISIVFERLRWHHNPPQSTLKWLNWPGCTFCSFIDTFGSKTSFFHTRHQVVQTKYSNISLVYCRLNTEQVVRGQHRLFKIACGFKVWTSACYDGEKCRQGAHRRRSSAKIGGYWMTSVCSFR